MRQLKPDFKTITDFRKINLSAFREVFRSFVRLCRELDLYGRELLAVDGTRIKAVNSKDRNFTKASLKRDLARLDERLERYLKDMNEADTRDDDGPGSGGSAKKLTEKIEVMKARRETVEHPFGSIKQWMGQGAFLMKRLDNVRGEFSLTALAYNIRRAITLVGIPALIEAAKA